jgi:hypothetical protein
MKPYPVVALLFLASAAFAADLPAIPDKPIAKKKELLFSDDFNRAELGPKWGIVVPTYTVENGALKGTQMRYDAPAQDGKPAIKGHQAVIGVDIPTKDSVIELKFRFAGAQSLTTEFDDRAFTGSHYGHLCMIRISPQNIIFTDQRDGGANLELIEMAKDPSRKEERAKRLQGRNATFPLQLAPEKWHDLVLETVGDEMRATIDGKPAGFLKSSGIAHPTKSKVELGCMGKDGFFDDIKIWNAEPAAK